MKYILLTDLHLGVRSNSKHFHDNIQLFCERVFFPYLNNNPALDIIFLGDLFDDRRKIDVYTAQRARKYFFEPLESYLVTNHKTMYTILGNHDIRFRDSLESNAIREFIADNFTDGRIEIIDRPTTMDNMLMIPWIHKNNRDQIFQSVADSSVDYLLGHLELVGHNYSKAQVSIHGDDPKPFEKFKAVLSGHYHYKHNKGNVHYLGSPTQHTWIDNATERGFHIFDSNTGILEFVRNPFDIFKVVDLGDDLYDGDHQTDPKYYRVNIVKGTKQSEVDKYIALLHDKHNAISVEPRYVGEDIRVAGSNKQLDLENIEDTPTFIKNYIEDEKISNLMISLYNRAINENSIP